MHNANQVYLAYANQVHLASENFKVYPYFALTSKKESHIRSADFQTYK